MWRRSRRIPLPIGAAILLPFHYHAHPHPHPHFLIVQLVQRSPFLVLHLVVKSFACRVPFPLISSQYPSDPSAKPFCPSMLTILSSLEEMNQVKNNPWKNSCRRLSRQSSSMRTLIIPAVVAVAIVATVVCDSSAGNTILRRVAARLPGLGRPKRIAKCA